MLYSEARVSWFPLGLGVSCRARVYAKLTEACVSASSTHAYILGGMAKCIPLCPQLNVWIYRRPDTITRFRCTRENPNPPFLTFNTDTTNLEQRYMDRPSEGEIT